MNKRLINFAAFMWILSIAVFAGGIVPTVFANFFEASGDLNIFMGATITSLNAIVVLAIAYTHSLAWLDSSAQLLPGFQAAFFALITFAVSTVGVLNPVLARQSWWLLGLAGAGIILLLASYSMPAVDEYTNNPA